MFKAVSKRLVSAAVEKDIVKHDELEEYAYGINTFLTTAVNLLSAIAVGLIFRMPLEIIFFIAVYKFLRKYIGGLHAKTALRCYVFSGAVYIAALLFIKNYPFQAPVTIALALVSSSVMLFLAPVEAAKKPLDETEKKVFKARARRNVLICMCAFLLLRCAAKAPLALYASDIVAVAALFVAIMAIAGKLFLKTTKRETA